MKHMKLLPGSFNKLLLLLTYRVNRGLYIGQVTYFSVLFTELPRRIVLGNQLAELGGV